MLNVMCEMLWNPLSETKNSAGRRPGRYNVAPPLTEGVSNPAAKVENRRAMKAPSFTKLILKLAVVAVVAYGSVVPAQAGRGPASERNQLRRFTYQRCTNETLDGVARLLGVPTSDLEKWNRNSIASVGGRKSFRRGVSRVVYYSRTPFLRESVGRPSSGSLVGGMNLDCDGDDRGQGWVVSVDRNSLYGTPETIRNIYNSAKRYRAYFRDRGLKFVPLSIGDISKPSGGPLPPHVSHQSGRDVDIGIILKSGNSSGRFLHANPSSMDLLRTWVMLKSFIDTSDVRYIFMHKSLADAIKTYVSKIYAKQRPLLRKYIAAFAPDGVIRPDYEHSSHVHVRFRCPKGDKRCID